MLKRLPNLTSRYSRLRKPPVSADTLAEAKTRGWQKMQVLLAEETMKQPTKPQFSLSPVLSLAFIVLVAAGVYTFSPSIKGLPSNSNVSLLTRATPVPADVALFLAQNSYQPHTFSGESAGLDIGYTKKSVSLNRSNIAYAAENTVVDPTVYDGEIFYTQDVNGIAQVFKYSLSNKKSVQVTHSDFSASRPIFSSSSQLLAYSDYISPVIDALEVKRCNSFIIDLKTKATIGAFDTANDCYTAISWSPDGSKLLLGHEHDVVNSINRGESPKYNLEVYSVKDKTTLSIATPVNFLGQEGGNWLDNTSFLVRYGNDFDLNSIQATFTIAKVNAISGDVTPIKTNFAGSGYEVIGKQAFFVRDTGTAETSNKQVMTEPFDQSRPATVVEGTKGVEDVLGFAAQDSGEVRTLLTGRSISITSANGYLYPVSSSDASAQVNATELASNAVKNTITDKGSYFDQFVGWHSDHNHLIYTTRNGDDGTVAVHELELASKEDQVLFSIK